MEIDNFPKRSIAQETGNKGEVFFENYITNEFNWIYRSVPQESDNGIDGYLDIVIDGAVTGQTIAVQIKTGDSYLTNKTKYGIKYFGEKKHINFYMNNPSFVLLVVIDIKNKKMYWNIFDFNKIIYENQKWWIEIPFENEISANTKNEWLELVGNPIDYIDTIQNESLMSSLFNTDGCNMVCIPKNEIDTLSLHYIFLLLKRISKTREMSEKNRNKLDFYFNAYDDDPRELFEIPEIRTWVQYSIDSGFPWFYLLNLEGTASGMIILFSCYACSIEKVIYNSKCKIAVDNKKLNEFFVKNFDNLKLYCENMKIEETIFNEIMNKINLWFNSLDLVK